MKGLILKDILNMRRYSRTSLMIIALYALIMYMTDNAAFLGGMIILLFSMMSISSFSYDDLAKWDKYALSLPVSRRDIVRGKYILALLLTFTGMAVSAAAGAVPALFKHTSWTENLILTYATFAVAVLFLSVLLPLIYKFGVEKSRILIIAVVAVPVAILAVLGQTGIAMPSDDVVKLLLSLSPAILVAAVFVSYSVSCALFGKKDL